MGSADQKQTPQGCFQPGTHLGFKLIVLALESRDNCVFQVSFFPRIASIHGRDAPSTSVGT